MLHLSSLPVRALALAVTLVTATAAVPVSVHHHADHPDEAVHLEHEHGGHGGLLEQDEARVPTPDGPALIGTGTIGLRTAAPIRLKRTDPDDLLHPLGRAPPPDLPRAPPLPA